MIVKSQQNRIELVTRPAMLLPFFIFQMDFSITVGMGPVFSAQWRRVAGAEPAVTLLRVSLARPWTRKIISLPTTRWTRVKVKI